MIPDKRNNIKQVKSNSFVDCNSLLATIMLATSFILASSSAWGVTTIIPTPQPATNTLSCLGTRNLGSMNCSAQEFTVGTTFSAAPGTPPFCIAGSTFSFQVELALSGSNANRYNMAFYTGETGNDSKVNDATKFCSVATFPTSPLPFGNIDNFNVCGDYYARGDSIITINQIKSLCQGDSAGALLIPYTLTYSVDQSEACTGPADVRPPNSPAKCQSATASVSGTVAVYSGAHVDVTKQTSPDGDTQPFSFTATGPVDSKVIALTGATLTAATATGGTYTPATIALATNSTTVTLTDGQTARFYINVLAAGQLLTITETADPGWESTAAISCAAVTGSPTLGTVPASRTITAGLSAANSAAACTVTNTKRSRITLQKSVAGRIYAADQFSVSASGGGTLTGTTSATTSLAGTAASTTFYSTPGTALTLTDAMASGSSLLSAYDTRLTCTNAFAGPGATSNASLPNNQRTASSSITPAPGDDITCTYTNTPGLTITKAFSPATIFAGNTSDITFTIRNNLAAAKTFTLKDNTIDAPAAWPAGMTVVTPIPKSNSCGGSFREGTGGSALTAANSGNGFQLITGNVPGDSTCTFVLTVTVPLAGTYNNQTSGAFPAGASPVSNIAILTAINRPPTITKTFNPSTVDSYTTSNMTFTLTNPNGSTLTTANFTDTLTGFSVAAPATVGGTCVGVTNSPALVAGATSLNLTVPNLVPGSCTITITVSSTTAGAYTNATSGITTTQTPLGVASNTATLTVNWLPLQVTKSPSVTTASPGASVTYTIGYGNPNATTKLQNIVVTDPVPLYTSYVSASCGPLPATITSCDIVFNPAPGNGIATWTMGGTLDAGKSGVVLLTVRIQ